MPPLAWLDNPRHLGQFRNSSSSCLSFMPRVGGIVPSISHNYLIECSQPPCEVSCFCSYSTEEETDTEK